MFFADLTPVDWAHHIINVLIMGVIAECWEWGKGVNATCFIMNGVPGMYCDRKRTAHLDTRPALTALPGVGVNVGAGGIDYMLLTLVKHGLMHSMTEKKLNTYLNMVIRFPGMVCTYSTAASTIPDVQTPRVGTALMHAPAAPRPADHRCIHHVYLSLARQASRPMVCCACTRCLHCPLSSFSHDVEHRIAGGWWRR
jgi:hypothetical protein